jgi:hypothetical protein
MKKIILFFMLCFCMPVFAEDSNVVAAGQDTNIINAVSEPLPPQPVENTSDPVDTTESLDNMKDVGSETIDSLMEKSPKFKGFTDIFRKKLSSVNDSAQNDIDQLKKGFLGNFNKDGSLVEGFVPLEAKVGRIFISVLSDLSRAIYTKLMPFLNMFIVMMLTFWIFGETWKMMSFTGDRDYWKLAIRITKKVLLIAAWLWVLNNDPAKLFMILINPLIVVGTAASDLILNGVLNMLDAEMPDTCGAIHAWVGNGADGLISNDSVANLLCMPTRVTTFFYTNINAGFNLMGEGLKNLLPVTFLMGLVFVVLFVINTWRFIIATLGVIVDLFFVLMFLPFTAVKECFKAKDTKYDGIFAPIWTQLLGLVGGQTLSEQIRKFVGAVIYFIVLSIISAISLIMIAGFKPTLDNAITLIIVGFLIFYMMSKEQVNKIAKMVSGEVDTGFGEQVDAASKKYAENIWKLVTDKFKSLSGKGGEASAGTGAGESAGTNGK